MKILVVKLADLGDLLLSEPAIRSMRQGYPDAQIDVLTTPHAARLLPHFSTEAHPITFEKSLFDRPGADAARSARAAAQLARMLRAKQYDLLLILHHLTTAWGTAKYRALALATGAPVVAGLDNGRGTFLTHRALDRGFGFKHEAEYMLDVAQTAGGSQVTPHPQFNVSEEALPFEVPSRFIALAPAAGKYSTARIWPLEHYITLATRLVAAGHSIIVVGGSDARYAGSRIVEAAGANRVMSLAGQTSLNQTALVLRQAAAVIGNDSFPAHLAAALDRPTIALFGPSNHLAWSPRSERAHALRLDLPCAPCLYTGYRLGRPEGCPSRTCLTQLAPAMVLKETLELLDA